MNWAILIITGIVLIILIIFLVSRNRIDKKDLETKLKNDYHKTNETGNDVETEETTK